MRFYAQEEKDGLNSRLRLCLPPFTAERSDGETPHSITIIIDCCCCRCARINGQKCTGTIFSCIRFPTKKEKHTQNRRRQERGRKTKLKYRRHYIIFGFASPCPFFLFLSFLVVRQVPSLLIVSCCAVCLMHYTSEISIPWPRRKRVADLADITACSTVT